MQYRLKPCSVAMNTKFAIDCHSKKGKLRVIYCTYLCISLEIPKDLYGGESIFFLREFSQKNNTRTLSQTSLDIRYAIKKYLPLDKRMRILKYIFQFFLIIIYI